MKDIKQFLKNELEGDESVFKFIGQNVEGFDKETLLLFAKWQVREDERRC